MEVHLPTAEVCVDGRGRNVGAAEPVRERVRRECGGGGVPQPVRVPVRPADRMHFARGAAPILLGAAAGGEHVPRGAHELWEVGGGAGGLREGRREPGV
eukprot:3129238-Rhodomonas_salina.1